MFLLQEFRLTLDFDKYEIGNSDTSYEEIKIVDSKFSTFGLEWLPEQQKQHLGTANVDTEKTDPARGSVSVTTAPARLATKV